MSIHDRLISQGKQLFRGATSRCTAASAAAERGLGGAKVAWCVPKASAAACRPAVFLGLFVNF